LNNPPGVSIIPITLIDTDLPHNDFGEWIPATLSGHVYGDISATGFNDGIRQSGEPAISGVSVTLNIQDDLGTRTAIASTDSNGYYQFTGLRPGTYALSEQQPAGWLDGKDTIGSQGGTTGQDQFTNITVRSGTNGVNNDFGELLASSLSGYVYADTSAG